MRHYSKAIAVIAAIVFCAGILPLTAKADMTGAGDAAVVAKLTQVYTILKEYYENAKKVLQEAKVQSDNLKDMREFSREVYKEYQFAKNFNAQRELDRIKEDMRGLTYLDNLDGKSTKEQIRLLMQEIDRRCRRSNNPKEREKHKQIKDDLATIERLSVIQDAKAQEVLDASGTKMSEKSLQASTASSTALMSSLMLAQEQRRLQREVNETQEEQERLKDFETMDKVLEKMKEK